MDFKINKVSFVKQICPSSSSRLSLPPYQNILQVPKKTYTFILPAILFNSSSHSSLCLLHFLLSTARLLSFSPALPNLHPLYTFALVSLSPFVNRGLGERERRYYLARIIPVPLLALDSFALVARAGSPVGRILLTPPCFHLARGDRRRYHNSLS